MVGNIYSHIDESCNQLHIYTGIVGNWKMTGAVYNNVQLYEKNGQSYKNQNKAGWYIEVEW